MKRLPIRPQPLPHEALSSWIRRMAEGYGLDVTTFLDGAFNYSEYNYVSALNFDIRTPKELIVALSKRTAVSVAKISAMTIEGYMPLLIDTTSPTHGLFKAYISQFPTLAPVRNEAPLLPRFLDETSWLPWLSPDSQYRACRRCLAEDPLPYRRIYWRLSWMSCCPLHGEMLEGRGPPRQASKSIIALDHLTLKAVTSGEVLLRDGRTIHGAVWLRSLRTLIDELARPTSALGRARHTIESIKKSIQKGYRPTFRVFEYMDSENREHIMQMIAETVEKLLSGAILPLCKSTSRKMRTTIFSSPSPVSKGDLVSVPPPKEPLPPLNANWDLIYAVKIAREYPRYSFDLRERMILIFGRVRVHEIDMHLRKYGVPIVKHYGETFYLRRSEEYVA